MKRYFIAYRFSGESREVLEERLTLVVDSLKPAGIDAYNNLSDQDQYQRDQTDPREIMQKAFAHIDASEGLLVLIASDDKSEGQLIEIGYALANKKHLIVAAQDNVKTYVDRLADVVIRWSDLADLKTKLEGLKV